MRGRGQMGAQSQLVAHGAAEDEQGGGEAGEVGEARFEVVGCGVGVEDVVEEGAGCDGREHGWGRGCDDVGAKVEGGGAGGGPGGGGGGLVVGEGGHGGWSWVGMDLWSEEWMAVGWGLVGGMTERVSVWFFHGN